jgi:hypothetical protein
MTGPGFPSAQYPGPYTAPYPVDYPQPGRRVPRWAWVAVAAVLLIGLALLLGLTANNTGSVSSQPTTTVIQRSVQGYFDALASGDTKSLARNASCGLFDEVRDKNPELSLMRLSSESFRKENGKVTLTSIDKVVRLSEYQLRVLFTVQAQKTANPQGQAELLLGEDGIYVCSAYLRTAGTF